MGCHEAITSEFHVGPLHPLSREEWLSSEVSPNTKMAYRHLEEARARLYSIFQGKDGLLILRQLRDRSAQNIEANLRAAFAEADSDVPLTIARGEELGRFNMGSTVILLFPQGRIAWGAGISAGSRVQMGQTLANVLREASSPPPS